MEQRTNARDYRRRPIYAVFCILFVAVAILIAGMFPVNAMLAPWIAAASPPMTSIAARAEPDSEAEIQATYPNGTMLAMTGRCTGGVDLLKMSNWTPERQEQAVSGQWCEFWHDPEGNGNFVRGWVAGSQLSRD